MDCPARSACCHSNKRSPLTLLAHNMQNRLEEYYTMLQWARGEYLEDKATFEAEYVAPIKRGQARDATPTEVRWAARRACE